jgi:hypothetical protein
VAEEPARTYTVEEANALTGHLREALQRIREARDTLVEAAEPLKESAPANGGGSLGTAVWEAARTLRQEIEDLARRAIVLRDADTGLFDFPSLREGRVVYLCWRPDEEERVAHWHEVDAGFPGRKPL